MLDVLYSEALNYMRLYDYKNMLGAEACRQHNELVKSIKATSAMQKIYQAANDREASLNKSKGKPLPAIKPAADDSKKQKSLAITEEQKVPPKQRIINPDDGTVSDMSTTQAPYRLAKMEASPSLPTGGKPPSFFVHDDQLTLEQLEFIQLHCPDSQLDDPIKIIDNLYNVALEEDNLRAFKNQMNREQREQHNFLVVQMRNSPYFLNLKKEYDARRKLIQDKKVKHARTEQLLAKQ